ncbi:DUF6415 family natural product biosynthesis protein [Streptomyces rubradiris]|uniref:DUF6415 family natural product biosynthesis protein n=1 Tax=Streptomyces rubradiris TaxID=285531 RepID=UPI0036E0B2C6
MALVLGDHAPLPETPGDVETLAARLRLHISQLAPILPAGDRAVTRAQRLSATAVPEGYVSSRVHLMHLAEATQSLIAAVSGRGSVAGSASRVPGPRPRMPSRNTVRLLVFAVVLATLILAASVPRA